MEKKEMVSFCFQLDGRARPEGHEEICMNFLYYLIFKPFAHVNACAVCVPLEVLGAHPKSE